jgi:tRNA-dihydrouridine synthase B
MTHFKIGTAEIPARVVLAPLSGITDAAFRKMCRRWGAGCTFADMLSADGLVRTNARTLSRIRVSGPERPIGAQLFGTDPGVMRDAACLLEAAGFDFVDINAGCPARKVVRRGAGSALAENPVLLGRVLSAVSNALRVGVTVKLRPQRDVHATVRLTKRLEDCGASAITIHGRSASQIHSGPVHVASIAAVKSTSRVPVIANGGVVSPEGAAALLRETESDAVMIGRGCLGRPWLFHRSHVYLSSGLLISEPSFEERIDICLDQLWDALRSEDERFVVPRMRKHLGWYLKGMPNSARVRSAVFTERTSEGITQILLEYRRQLSYSPRSVKSEPRDVAQSS